MCEYIGHHNKIVVKGKKQSDDANQLSSLEADKEREVENDNNVKDEGTRN